jgi:hypothetical protein
MKYVGSALMFIDTSVIVAIPAREPEADGFAGQIAESKARFTSGLVVLEASMRLSTQLDLDPALVETRIQALLDEAGISVVSIIAASLKRLSQPSPPTARNAVIPRNSIWPIACPMPVPGAIAFRCCSRAIISRDACHMADRKSWFDRSDRPFA